VQFSSLLRFLNTCIDVGRYVQLQDALNMKRAAILKAKFELLEKIVNARYECEKKASSSGSTASGASTTGDLYPSSGLKSRSFDNIPSIGAQAGQAAHAAAAMNNPNYPKQTGGMPGNTAQWQQYAPQGQQPYPS
jgi:hypothetical protein